MAANDPHPLEPRLAVLHTRTQDLLLGPDAREWTVAIERDPPGWLRQQLPPGALLFADSGGGDHLFLVPGRTEVMVNWRDEPWEVYCASLEALVAPDGVGPPSAHGPVYYAGTQQQVLPGDRVLVKHGLWRKSPAEITYVPGLSPYERAVEGADGPCVRATRADGSFFEFLVEDATLSPAVVPQDRPA